MLWPPRVSPCRNPAAGGPFPLLALLWTPRLDRVLACPFAISCPPQPRPRSGAAAHIICSPGDLPIRVARNFAIVSAQSRGEGTYDMNRYGFALAAILADSPASAAMVTTCHKCAERYGVRPMALKECPAEWPAGANMPVTDPHATAAQIAAAERCIRRLIRGHMRGP
jgi:hypothetical protein